MKKAILPMLCVLFINVAVYSLQAPTIINVTGNNANKLSLTWRNNSVNYDSIIVLRKTNAAPFSIAAKTGGTIQAYTDTGLGFLQKYYYALVAFNQTEKSDTSNIDSATTASAPLLCSLSVSNTSVKMGTFTATWNADSLKTNIQYGSDTFCDDNRIEIYRQAKDGAVILLSGKDTSIGSKPYTFVDVPDKFNSWYIYSFKIGNGSSFRTAFDTVFTFNSKTFFDTMQIVHKQILSTFPISLNSTSMWALKHNDSLWIKEANTDSNVYSVIDVKDPANPAFKTYKTFTRPLYSNNGITCGNTLYYGQALYSAVDTGLFKVHMSGTTGLIWPDPYSQGSWQTTAFGFFVNDTILLTFTQYTHGKGSFGYTAICHETVDFKEFTYRRINEPYCNKMFAQIRTQTISGTDSIINNEYMFAEYFDTSKVYIDSFVKYSGTITTPFLVSNYITSDTIFTKANYVFLDTIKKNAFVLTNSLLTIYSYDFTAQTAIAAKPFSNQMSATASIPRISYSNGYIKLSVPADYINGKVTFFDVRGRLVANINKFSNSEMRFSANSFGNGIFVAVFDNVKNRQNIKFTVAR